MRTLYVKFVLTTIAIMLLSSLFAFMFSNFYYQQKLKQDNDEKVTNIAIDIADYIKNEQNIQLDHYLEHISNIGYQMLLIDVDGNELFYGSRFREKNLPKDIKDRVLNGKIYHGIKEFPHETFVTGFFANELSNTIGVPIEHQQKKYALFIRPNIKLLFNEMHVLFAWLLAATIILSVVLVLISTRFLIDPISKLTKATQDLSDGNFAIRLDINRADEIGKLAKNFTHMAKQLEKLDEMKNEFISNITHDIQSPLSNMKGYSILLGKDSLTKEEKSHYISIINKEISRLSSLTNQLLLLASLDQQDDVLNKEKYSLSDQLRKVIFNYQWLMNDKRIMVTYKLPDTYIYADSSLLYSVWDNLLTNAIKYNKLDGTIEISIVEKERAIDIHFKDSGIGFNEEDRERIFDRFYRVDTARSRTIEGTGLGLSIVSAIVALHHGIIRVESQKDKGSIFIVSLPKL